MKNASFWINPWRLIPRLSVSLIFVIGGGSVFAQNANDIGTSAESKPGQSTASTYSMDKLETVNLSNGNMSLHIPLVTIGGRGSAAFAVSLAYNSKVWTPYHEQDPAYTDPFGNHIPALNHWSAKFDDLAMRQPGVFALGSGWTVLYGYSLKVSKVNIQPIRTSCSAQPDCGYKYVLTRMWLMLPDGSEVELRDSLTDGAPALTPTDGSNYHPPTDRARGRAWHSTDGSEITYVADAEISTQTDPSLDGWVFYPDGTRLRMSGTSGMCTKIIDRNGNFITFDGSTYTDELGRQVTLASTESTLTVTVKGYDGLADRVITADLATIGALENGVPTNLRADVRSMERPFYSGDYLRTRDGNGDELDWEHTDSNPHTDLFSGSENPDPVDLHLAVTSLNLLDGRSFHFRYNQYGELAEVVYPGGGVSQIDYSAGGSGLCEAGPAALRVGLNRRVTQRRSLTDGSNVDAATTYSFDSGYVDGTLYPRTIVEAHQGSTSGTLLSSNTHYFLLRDAEYRSCAEGTLGDGTGYEKWQNAKEFRTELQTGNGTTVTKRTWAQRASVSWPNDVGYSYNWYVTYKGQEQPPNDPRVTVEDTILENGRMKRVEYDYDNFNNVVAEREYDFGDTNGSVGALTRQTLRTYGANINSNYGIVNNGICYSNLNPSDANCGSDLATDLTSIVYQPRLLLNETVKDGNNSQAAYSEFEYDNYSGATNHAAIVVNSGMIKYDGTQFSSFSSTYQPRGNVTKVTHWAGGSNYITSFAQYDNAGNVVLSIDPKGNGSTVSYADNFGDGSNPDSGSTGTNGATFALATLLTNALNHQSKSQYNYTLGAPAGMKDANGVISKTEYDSIGRPVRSTAALGLGEQVVGETTYPTASANVATASRQFDATRWQASKTIMDGFDRVVTSWQAEDGQKADAASFTIRVDSVHDALGRVKQISNPYRPGAGESAIYTTTAYDLAGRVTSVTTPDSAVVGTSYSGNEVTVTDQAEKHRKSVTDGLGRLRKVIEDPTTGGFNYETDYDYDVLDDLVTVTQTGQTRSFVYDPLKRLTSATNPESGRVCYGTVDTNGNCQANGYDANGNLVYKTDARSILTTYAYDALNRVYNRHYSDGTPEVTYSYDPNIANGKGRLASVSSSVSSYSYGIYDALGRVKSATQIVYGQTNQTYTMNYGYDLAGHVTSISYPSGHFVSYNYDNAGRSGDKDSNNLAFTGNLGDGAPTPRTYSQGLVYDAGGRMTQEQFGTSTAIYNKLFYNSRGQLAEIREGVTPNNTDWERGAIINHYSDLCWGMCGGSQSSTAMTDNNGNLKKQDIYIPGVDGFATDWFSYDALNRLQLANETYHVNSSNTNTDVWRQTYVYDRYGNRTIAQGSSDTFGLSSFIPNYAASTSSNKLYGPGETDTSHSLIDYDPAGNQKKDHYSDGTIGKYYDRSYDAENRMGASTTTYADNSTQVSTYSYDGDGHRVKRKVGTVETWQVYGLGGELVAEYAASAAAASPEKEYGYRNGQLLITTTCGSGYGDPPTLHDNPLVVGETTVQARHITELRTAINTLRAREGMAAYSWTTSATTSDWINAGPIAEMRTALDQVLGPPPSGYGSDLASGQPIKAIHIQELRDRLTATWSIDIRWLVTDQLGTPRIIFDASGSLVTTSRHDYLPFGEELFAGIGGRTQAQGYSLGDGARQKFTQKERDNETGLDYFLARYYSSTQGRFTSPDEFTGGPEEIGVLGSGHPEKQALKYAEVTNPQSLNKYQYCFNNPLRYVDPDGQDPQTGGDLNFERDERDFLSHKISEQEFRSRMNARGVGAAVGAAIVVGVLYGPEAATAILMWASRNPDKVGQIALDLNQASTGSPAPGSPGLSIAAETRLTATEVSTGVRLAAQTGTRLAESPFVGEEFVSTAGKTYDAMGGGKAFQNFGNGSKFFDSIVHHVNKSVDYVALDLKGASAKQINAIQKFVGGLTKKQQEKIIYVKE